MATTEEREVEAGTAEPGGEEAALYDFRRPNRVSKDRLRTIQAIFDRLVSSFGLVFQQRLRSQVEVELADLAQMTFGEYAAELEKPCSAFIYRLGDPDESEAMVDFGQHLPFHVIDRLFGGHGEAYDHVRALTATERNAFREQVVDRMMTLFADAWQDHIPFQPEFKEFEFTPEVMEMALREDPVLVAVFRITVHDLTTTFSLCLPISALESFLALSGKGRLSVTGGRAKVKASAEDRRSLTRHLLDAVVTLSARVPTFRLLAHDMAGIGAGTTIHTGVPADRDLDMVIGARAHFRARPARVGSILGAELTECFLDAEGSRRRKPLGRVMDEGGEARGTPAPAAAGLRELTLPVVVEIGQARVPVHRVLEYTTETLIELDRHAGEPVDVYVAGRLFARAEIVRIETGDAADEEDGVVYLGLRVVDLDRAAAEDDTAAELAALEDLDLPVRVEIGRTWMFAEQLGRLGRGSLVELDRGVSEPCDVFVGDRLFARGAVVQEKEHFAIRIVERTSGGVPTLPDVDAAPTEADDGPSAVAPARLQDLALHVSVELGRTRRLVREITALDSGDVLVLDRFAGEPCDLFVGDCRFAEGEVVPVGDRFGVKLTNFVGARRAASAEVG